MINRRQFIKRIVGGGAGLVAFGRPVLHSEPTEMPVTLSNRSVFYPLWGNWGIKSGDVRSRAVQLQRDDLTALINKTVANLNDDQGAEVCMDNLAMELHKLDCYPGYYPVGIDDGGATMRRMNRILAANPDMTREQAFFEAVMEGAETTT